MSAVISVQYSGVFSEIIKKRGNSTHINRLGLGRGGRGQNGRAMVLREEGRRRRARVRWVSIGRGLVTVLVML